MVEGGAKRKRSTRSGPAKKTTLRKTTRTTRSTVKRRKPLSRRLGAGTRKTTTRRTAKSTTARRTKPLTSAKGKPRGAHHIGKYTGKFLKEIWAKAKKEDRRPTGKEFKEAMDKGWALARKEGAV